MVSIKSCETDYFFPSKAVLIDASYCPYSNKFLDFKYQIHDCNDIKRYLSFRYKIETAILRQEIPLGILQDLKGTLRFSETYLNRI